MKSFKFAYTKIVWALLFLVVTLALISLAWNIYNLICFLDDGLFKIISYSIIVVLTLALLIFTISVIFYGRYIIKDQCLISYFGFVRTKYKISNLTEITHFKKSDKLVVYFADNSYTVIVISPQYYDQFVLSIREQNPAIRFDAKIDGEDTPL